MDQSSIHHKSSWMQLDTRAYHKRCKFVKHFLAIVFRNLTFLKSRHELVASHPTKSNPLPIDSHVAVSGVGEALRDRRIWK
jgi:hypothetical protein